MSNIKWGTAFFLLFFICNFSNGQVEKETETSRYQGMNVGSETRILDSRINDKHYKLYVNLPKSYETHTDRKYPVLYALDGQYDFASIVSIQGSLRYDRRSPELIIIGVSYAGENPDYETLRANDMTPTVIPQIKNSGAAEKFTAVFRDEIIPFIDKEYRTQTENRTLTGTSLAGLYTHYALFKANDLFHNFVICNPSYWYDNGHAFALERDYSKNNDSLNANVFLVSGSLDGTISLHHEMAEQIASRKYKSLHFESSISEGTGHSGAKAEGYTKGMLHSFKRRDIGLSEPQLQPYTGTYRFAPGNEVSLIIHEGQLAIARLGNQMNLPIYALTEDSFCLQGSYNMFEFTKNDTGSVTGLTLEVGPDNMVSLEKVK